MMNERIAKLHQQAMEHSNNTGTTHFEYMIYAEKFAELIVQECAELMETQHTWITSVAASTLIRNHFKNEKF